MQGDMQDWGFALLACAVTALAIRFGAPLCVRCGLVDAPDHRKHHEGRIPLAGGPAMALGLAAAFLSAWPALPENTGGLVPALLLMLAVGIVDDRRELSARIRLLAQIGVALILVFGEGLVVQSVGKIFGTERANLHEWGPLFTVFGIVGVVNALNMMDGMDGLGGGVALIAFAWFALVAAASGMHGHFLLALIFCAATAGFLAFNLRHPWRSRASVFMGDSGSMMLGLALAWFAVDLTQGPGRSFPPMCAVWLLGLPLLDTLSLMFCRMIKRRSPFAPDREHLHHALLRAGFSPAAVVAIMLAISALFGAIGFFAWMADVSRGLLFYGALFVYAVYVGLSLRAWKVSRWLHRHGPARAGD